MIDGVQSCKIKPGDIIGVENHDRLTRRPPLEAIELFIAFLNAGIVLDINGNIRTKEILNAALGFGLLVQDLIEMFRAYQESQRKSEFGIKTNLSKRESARNGERRVMKAGAGCFVGRRCPAWLRALTMPSPEGYLYAIIPDAPDQPWRSIARRAFLMADAGHGVGTISRRFNDDRVPPLETAHRLSANPNQRRKSAPSRSNGQREWCGSCSATLPLWASITPAWSGTARGVMEAPRSEATTLPCSRTISASSTGSGTPCGLAARVAMVAATRTSSKALPGARAVMER